MFVDTRIANKNPKARIYDLNNPDGIINKKSVTNNLNLDKNYLEYDFNIIDKKFDNK